MTPTTSEGLRDRIARAWIRDGADAVQALVDADAAIAEFKQWLTEEETVERAAVEIGFAERLKPTGERAKSTARVALAAVAASLSPEAEERER